MLTASFTAVRKSRTITLGRTDFSITDKVCEVTLNGFYFRMENCQNDAFICDGCLKSEEWKCDSQRKWIISKLTSDLANGFEGLS